MLGLLYKDLYTAKKELLLTGFMALLFVGYNLIHRAKGDVGAFHWRAGLGGEPGAHLFHPL